MNTESVIHVDLFGIDGTTCTGGALDGSHLVVLRFRNMECGGVLSPLAMKLPAARELLRQLNDAMVIMDKVEREEGT